MTAQLPPAGTPFRVPADAEAILELVAAGLPDKAIGPRVGLSTGGVRSRLQRVYRQTGQRGRCRVAVLYALSRASR